MAYLIELYAGAFPTWLAPVQAIVIPIADRHADYAHEVLTSLRTAGLRVEIDARSERMNSKIRDAQLQKIPYMLVVGDREAELEKIPYMLVVGDREAEEGNVAVRRHHEGDIGTVTVERFAEHVLHERAVRHDAPLTA